MNDDTIIARLEEVKAYTLLAAKEMLTIEDVALLTGFKPSTIRRMAQDGRVPYYKPAGKNLFFKKSEINAFLQGNRVASITEIINS